MGSQKCVQFVILKGQQLVKTNPILKHSLHFDIIIPTFLAEADRKHSTSRFQMLITCEVFTAQQ